VLLPQPGVTDKLEAGTSPVLLLAARTVSGPVPVNVRATGETLPAPAVKDWLAPDPMLTPGPAGFVTVTVIAAGAGRLAPSRADTVTVADPVWPMAGVTESVQESVLTPHVAGRIVTPGEPAVAMVAGISAGTLLVTVKWMLPVPPTVNE
jgi:hypothetical protein